MDAGGRADLRRVPRARRAGRLSRHVVVDVPEPRFVWIDLIDPGHEELRELAAEYGLFPTLVEDSLQADHLPKYEKVRDVTFMIVRAYDEHAGTDARTVQELTRKIAIFFGPDFVLTIHRRDQPFIAALRDDYRGSASAGHRGRGDRGLGLQLLIDLVNGAVETFEVPLDRLDTVLDEHEDSLFSEVNIVPVLRELHELKHRINVLKRVLWHTLNAVVRLVPSSEPTAPLYQDLRESVETLHVHADELLEDANNLLHLQLGLASHRTNQIVRVLTVFSVFFMPLTFIVGVYGMNFQFMPELRQRWGYPAVLGLMAVVAGGIYLWFRRRGWLKE